MAGGYFGVVEIVRGVAGHSELFHDPARAQVRGHGEGHDFGEVEGLEAVLHDRAGAFGGESTPPTGRIEPPPDLHAGGEASLKGRNGEADESGEFVVLAQLGGEGTESVAQEVR